MTIRRLLIANRGEIALRIMRTCRTLGIETVAVHSDADADALFVRAADHAVALGGASAASSYLRIDAIIDAARRTGADAVHPGYGFLSENAAFAAGCIAAGLVWVGPPPHAIETMGSKLAARALMTQAGVAVVPGADLRDADDARLASVVDELGLPLLVKASAGGGGRGMRIVRDASALADAVVAARREASSAFGDGAVFVERYIEQARHIEVQVIADTHGHVVHLFERECSIQRRHQKIIEEAPSPFATPELRERMGQAAVTAARSVGYVGVGTVEFIVDSNGGFCFLEMNTRLQVEHPVTEAITGLDLVQLQLAIAEGGPLPDNARSPVMQGHAIEARLYAEDPDNGYLPSPGTLHCVEFPQGDSVRVDTGFASGDSVSAHYDPLLAKLIVHASTRDEAARLLATTLRRTRVDGVITNRELLIGIIEHAEFLAGATDTSFLERNPPRSMTAGRPTPHEVVLGAVASALAQQASSRADATVMASIPSGFRNNRAHFVSRTYRFGGEPITVGYALSPSALVEVDGVALDGVAILGVTSTSVELAVDGVRRRYVVDDRGDVVHVATVRGSVTLAVEARFPSAESAPRAGSLVAPMPGTVVRVDARPGVAVTAGEVLAVLEAMKMEHTITAPLDGVVEDVLVQVGQSVDAGAVLVVIAGRDAEVGES
jgi:propionyl-CoA carboxylase alpha chain